jgi:hypothetical protein
VSTDYDLLLEQVHDLVRRLDPPLTAEMVADGWSLGAASTGLSQGEQVALSRGLGNAYRDEIAANIDQMPNRMATTEVYKRTPFGARFIDVEVSDGSNNVLGGSRQSLVTRCTRSDSN